MRAVLSVLFLLLLSSQPARAGCVSPTGQSSHPVFKTDTGLQFCPDGDNWTTVATGAPGGGNGHVQFNDNGGFGGDSGLFWDNVNKRLGIGTLAPVTRLHVYGAGDQRITVENDGTGSAVFVAKSGTHPSYFFTNTAGDLRMYPNTKTGITILGSNGHVGINTTAPDVSLTVEGSGSAPMLFSVGGTSNGAMKVRHIEGKSPSSAATGDLYLNYMSGGSVSVGSGVARAVLYIYGTGTDCSIGSGTSTTACTSDRRLKKDIVPIDGALEKIARLNGVYFEWTDPSKTAGRHVGVIAQDVEAVFPELVQDMDNAEIGRAKTVDAAALVAPLIEAVKELKAQNAQIRAELDALRQAR